MTGKTIKLKKGNDNLKGGAEGDTFNALATKKGLATLSDSDVLNGRGGVDTVNAFIATDTLTPNLKNIEKAVFTRTAATDLSLDLSKSLKLDAITLDKFGSGISISNAAALSSLSVNAIASGKAVSIAGVDTTKVPAFSLAFSGSAADVSLAAKDAAKFAAVNLGLVGGISLRFAAPLAAETLNVAVTGASELKGIAAGWLGASKVSVSGAAKFTADLGAAAALTTLDGSTATGDITLTLGGAALTSLKTGAGNDTVTVSGKTAAGGTLVVDLGTGDNVLKGSAADWLGAKSLTLSGAGKVTADLGSAGALATFDSSAVKGDVTVTLGGAAVTSLKTGAGNDTVTVSGKTAAGGTLVVDLGAGTDVLKGSAADWLGAKSLTLSGAGKVTADLGTAAALTSIDGSAMTGAAHLTLASAATGLSIKTGSGNDTVTIGSVKGAQFELNANLGAGVDSLDVTLNAQSLAVKSATGTETLRLHTSGAETSLVAADGLMSISGMKSIVVDGGASEFSMVTNVAYSDLETVDASAFNGKVVALLNTPVLKSFKTGTGNDQLTLFAIGGNAASKAVVDLGTGDDRVTLGSTFQDHDHVQLKAGSGFDVLFLTANPASLTAFSEGFEGLSIDGATGTYDLTSNAISRCFLDNPAGDITLTGFASGSMFNGVFSSASIGLLDTFASGLTVTMADAAGTADTLRLDIMGNLGGAAKGFTSAGLSKLVVTATGNSVQFFLGQIGAANDGAELVLDQDIELKIKAVTGASSFIDTVTVNNGTLDMLDLAGKSYFAASGVTIAGGAGNDKLATGGGTNTIEGGGGLDMILLSGGGSSDTLVFKSAVDSSYGAADTVTNFQKGVIVNGNEVVTDRIDLTAFNLSNVNYAGKVASDMAGSALLSTAQVKAFFNTTTDQLVIDIDKSGNLSGSDFAVTLIGLNDIFWSGILL